jgi:hypothetical protein
MILDKPVKQGATVSVKLTSGEEILGCYMSESSTQLVLEKPATISATPDGKMGIIPWMMTSRATKISLNMSTVVAFAITEDEIAKAYTQSTSVIKLA